MAGPRRVVRLLRAAAAVAGRRPGGRRSVAAVHVVSAKRMQVHGRGRRGRLRQQRQRATGTTVGLDQVRVLRRTGEWPPAVGFPMVAWRVHPPLFRSAFFCALSTTGTFRPGRGAFRTTVRRRVFCRSVASNRPTSSPHAVDRTPTVCCPSPETGKRVVASRSKGGGVNG